MRNVSENRPETVELCSRAKRQLHYFKKLNAVYRRMNILSVASWVFAFCLAGVKGEEVLFDPSCVDFRLLELYNIKGCTPVFEEGNPCPVRFNCPPLESTTDSNVCIHNGTTYNVGDRIKSSDPCVKCDCVNSWNGARIDQCRMHDCYLSDRYEEGCYLTHSLDHCCATGTICANEISASDQVVVCELDGKQYRKGERMTSRSNPCLTCICDENWNGVSDTSCRKTDCMYERLLPLTRGCLPLYFESWCCPIETHCPNSKEEVVAGPNSEDNSDYQKQCVFNEKRGNIGDILYLNRKYDCSFCVCKTPPEFSCTKEYCPRGSEN